MFQEKAHQTAQHEEKDLQTNMKQHWILSVPLVFHISNYVNPATHQGTGTALAIINITYLGGMVYSEGTDFGRREQKVSKVGTAATSSVRSFQSLIALGKKENFL